MNQQLLPDTTDAQGRPLPDSFLHYWNGTTSAELELEKLKLKQELAQVKKSDITFLKQMMEELTKKVEPIQTDVNYIRRNYSNAISPLRPVSAEAKDFLKDILQPVQGAKKLTKKEQIQARADQITTRDNLKLLQKHSKIRG